MAADVTEAFSTYRNLQTRFHHPTNVSSHGSSSNLSTTSDSTETGSTGDSKHTGDSRSTFEIGDDGDTVLGGENSISSPENCVYFVTSKPEGKLLYLDTNSKALQEFPNIPEDSSTRESGGSLNIISCCPQKHSIWALTDDGSVYMYQFPTTSRIRHQVHTYENQRYRPFMGGWTSKLLALDRYPWSSKGGHKSLPKDSFRLLSPDCWQWEGAWKLAVVVDGQATEKDGWQFAGNFTSAAFGAQGMLTAVRRRKWVRYMTFSKYSQWFKIELPSKISTSYPIQPGSNSSKNFKREVVCLSVGGSRLNGAVKGHLSVWVLTSDNRLLFREGVCATRPEGSHWRVVESLIESINQITVGPSGATWIVTWNGNLLVRKDVNARSPWGSKWITLVASEDKVVPRFQRVSLGEKSAWAISANAQKVYYLPNIEAKFIDYKWIPVVGDMFGVYVGLNNQVWAVPLLERSGIFFRDKVNTEEICGRGWKKMEIDFNDVISCGSNGDIQQSSNSIISERTTCKIREVSPTSFEWDPATAFSCFSKSAKFNIQPNLRNEIVAKLLSIKLKQEVPFASKTEYVRNQIVESNGSVIENRERLSREVSTDIILSKNRLKIADTFSKCQVSVRSQNDTNDEFLHFQFQENDENSAFIELSKIVCVRQKNDLDNPTLIINFVPYTTNSGVFHVIFQTFKDLFLWEEDLRVFLEISQKQANSESSISHEKFENPMFFIDNLGSSFVHFPLKDFTKTITWEAMAGHWSKIICFGELIFGLTDDKSVWVMANHELKRDQNGSFTENQTDSIAVTVFEIETWNVAIGYRGKYFECIPKTFWNEGMALKRPECLKDLSCVQLPNTRWEWNSEWFVDYSFADRDGWSYGWDLENPGCFHAVPARGDIYRRRLHKRLCTFKQKSGWRILNRKPAIVEMAASNMKSKRGTLLDELSQSKVSKCFSSKDSMSSSEHSNSHANRSSSNFWALDEDGNVFCAMFDYDKVDGNVSGEERWDWSECIKWRPLLPTLTQQVDNHQMMSITALDYSGGQMLVGLSNDGITLIFCYRDYFNPVDGPPGIVEPKKRHKKLQRVCAGGDRCTLLVIDCYNTLWIRDGTSWEFPEGQSWSKLLNNVTDVTVDLDNTIWVIMSSYDGRDGVMALLYNISSGHNYLQCAHHMVAAPKLSLNKKFELRIVLGPNVKHISSQSFTCNT